MSSRTRSPAASSRPSESETSAQEAPNGQAILNGMLKRRPKGATSDAGAGQAISGHLEGIDDEGRLLFSPEGAAGRLVPIAIGMEISDGLLVKAARLRRRALVMRTADASPHWVLVGLVRERVAAKARDARPGQLEVTLDGETVRLSAERSIELRCGSASLLLRKDGKVVLTGTHLVSASRGSNRIRGATISLN